MARTFQLKLTLLFNQRIDDLGGNWQYAGASAIEEGTKTARSITTKRENATCCNSFPASILTATVMFPAEAGKVPPNMTIQGVHGLTPTTKRAASAPPRRNSPIRLAVRSPSTWRPAF